GWSVHGARQAARLPDEAAARRQPGQGAPTCRRARRRGDSPQDGSPEVTIPDANVLLYATNRGAVAHQESRRWLEHALGGGEPVGFAWNVLLAFIRIATKAQIFERPL